MDMFHAVLIGFLTLDNLLLRDSVGWGGLSPMIQQGQTRASCCAQLLLLTQILELTLDPKGVYRFFTGSFCIEGFRFGVRVTFVRVQGLSYLGGCSFTFL